MYINKRQIVAIQFSPDGATVQLTLPKGFIALKGDKSALQRFVNSLTQEQGAELVQIPSSLQITDGTQAS